MRTPIITFTSDFGIKDYYVAATKGRILSLLPQATIVDISHQIAPFNISEAAYNIKNSYTHFPKGSIHFIAVDTEWSIENRHLIFYINKHYFICADNGIMSLIITDLNPEKVIEIPNLENESFFLANFIEATHQIANGKSLESIGKPFTEITITKEVKPFISNDKTRITGYVIYVDNFGNIKTNIDKNTFDSISQGRDFTLKVFRYEFNKIYKKYNDVVNFDIDVNKREDDGKSIALFDSDNLLEIALYRSNTTSFGSASSLLGLKYRDPITIIFK